MCFEIIPFSSKFLSYFFKYLSCILEGLFYLVDSYYSHIKQEKFQVLVVRCQILKDQTVNLFSLRMLPKKLGFSNCI